MIALKIILLTLASIGNLYYVVSTYALAAHFGKRRPKTSFSHPKPSVSVLKPVSGLDADAENNFLSFINQNYEDFEVLFGTLDDKDPSVSLIRRLSYEHKHVFLHTGSDLEGANNKVRILHNLAKHATGEIIVITDADTRVKPEFLAAITTQFEDKSVGAVTCMYRGTEAKSTADMLEGLHMTCIFEPGVACAYLLGVEFGLGATIAVRRSVLDQSDGFKAFVDHLADDYQLAHNVIATGKQVILSDYVIDIILSGERPINILARELRWRQAVKASNPLGYIGLIVTYGLPYAAFFWMASGFSILSWSVLIGSLIVRLSTAYIGAHKYLGEKGFTRRIHLLPICDLLAFGTWAAAFLIRTVKWRGRRLRLSKNGKIASQMP
jgi:ceramide glucosyltransferase